MTCGRCKSENVNVQVIPTMHKKSKGCMYWLFIGWWFELGMWIFLTLPMLLFKIFKPTKYEQKLQKRATCQNCGHSWPTS